jgi:cobalt-zinc-cadmium efflux system membrane fusion protein
MLMQYSKKKSAMAVLLVLLLGLGLGLAIWRSDKSQAAGGELGHAEPGHGESAAHGDESPHQQKAEAGHDDHDEPGDSGDAGHHGEAAAPAMPETGPHGGKLFGNAGFGLELSIFESGVAPQFRVHLYRDGQPLPPGAAQVQVTLERLGQPPEVFGFASEKDYLLGSAIVEEPHSFDATIKAQVGGQVHEFTFEQVEGRVRISDEQRLRNGVEIATAGPARIRSSLQLLGEVKLNQDFTVFVTPRLSGIALAVRANAGDRVRKGQVLAVIASQALADQRADWLASQRRLALARTTFEREKTLWEEKISAEQDYLAARQAFQQAEITTKSASQKLASLGAGVGESNQDLTRYEIRSPIDGVVTDKRISVGQALKDDAPIFQVADLSTVWVELTVPAKAVHRLQVGDRAKVRTTAFDAEAWSKLSYVGALVGEQSRHATARLVLANPEGLWRPGLPVTVDLSLGEVEVAVAVAAAGLQTLGDSPVVFGRYGQQFEARPLQLGRSDGRHVEVLRGLRAGERYAVKNSFLIKADIGKSGASHDH